jgi:hypothetical protein
LQIRGAKKLQIRTVPNGFPQIALRQLVMRFRKTRVQLNGVFELDSGFAILSGFEVLRATLEILLFSDVGITGTTQK